MSRGIAALAVLSIACTPADSQEWMSRPGNAQFSSSSLARHRDGIQIVPRFMSLTPDSTIRDTTIARRLVRGAAVGGAIGFIAGVASECQGCDIQGVEAGLLVGFVSALIGAPIGAFLSYELGRPNNAPDRERDTQLQIGWSWSFRETAV